jgi:hypothetical protein
MDQYQPLIRVNNHINRQTSAQIDPKPGPQGHRHGEDQQEPVLLQDTYAR